MEGSNTVSRVTTDMTAWFNPWLKHRQFEVINLHAHAHTNKIVTKELWLLLRTGVGLLHLPTTGRAQCPISNLL